MDVNLWALPDPPPGQEPLQSRLTLMKLAIHGSEEGKLTLQGIRKAFEDRFVCFRESRSSSWKNTIRRYLSLHDAFRKESDHFWSVDAPNEGRKQKDAAPHDRGCSPELGSSPPLSSSPT
ncbi:hypothetical protein P691DRAFT_811234 [Macrolepiota fuliginosa MF-IS2]|uniref:Fork-head domain-containing protein n=1 Tax=Macrolepiota fuliginosa MF-IS2 TaxID=1400762 RepID=A0A9P5X0U1_9AGAR|nr:hypothetical protein P691DRAFT_811234 [Macrolepiota fuliginosa MF-IS2]